MGKSTVSLCPETEGGSIKTWDYYGVGILVVRMGHVAPRDHRGRAPGGNRATEYLFVRIKNQ